MLSKRGHRGQWTSYQIRKIVGFACAGNARDVFPATDFKRIRLLAIPACITARASRTCHWCMSGSLTRWGEECVPGIPGACTTRNFTYLARGPWVKTYLQRSELDWWQALTAAIWSALHLSISRHVESGGRLSCSCVHPEFPTHWFSKLRVGNRRGYVYRQKERYIRLLKTWRKNKFTILSPNTSKRNMDGYSKT